MYEKIANNKRLRLKLTVALQKAVIDKFERNDWINFADITGFREQVRNHNRLLRSLEFGDCDYENHASNMLHKILEDDLQNIEHLIAHKEIRNHLMSREPEISIELNIRNPEILSHISEEIYNSSASTMKALKDAEALIVSNGAPSAVDRIHTAIHGYLKFQCAKINIPHESDASITKLYKLLRENHPKLSKTGTQQKELDKILMTLSSIIQEVSTLRNHASLAHPNANLLGEPEAKLAINASYTFLNYISQKISSSEN